MTEEGGKVVGSTIAHPIINRRGLLMDSEITSRYALSFVRSGGTLETIPCRAKMLANMNIDLLFANAQASPTPRRAAHSIRTMFLSNWFCTADRRTFVGWNLSKSRSSHQ